MCNGTYPYSNNSTTSWQLYRVVHIKPLYSGFVPGAGTGKAFRYLELQLASRYPLQYNETVTSGPWVFLKVWLGNYETTSNKIQCYLFGVNSQCLLRLQHSRFYIFNHLNSKKLVKSRTTGFLDYHFVRQLTITVRSNSRRLLEYSEMHDMSVKTTTVSGIIIRITAEPNIGTF